jgi:hypothetical protein
MARLLAEGYNELLAEKLVRGSGTADLLGTSRPSTPPRAAKLSSPPTVRSGKKTSTSLEELAGTVPVERVVGHVG